MTRIGIGWVAAALVFGCADDRTPPPPPETDAVVPVPVDTAPTAVDTLASDTVMARDTISGGL